MKLVDFKTSQKLTFGFGTLIAFTLIIVSASFWGLRNYGQAMDDKASLLSLERTFF